MEPRVDPLALGYDFKFSISHTRVRMASFGLLLFSIILCMNCSVEAQKNNLDLKLVAFKCQYVIRKVLESRNLMYF